MDMKDKTNEILRAGLPVLTAVRWAAGPSCPAPVGKHFLPFPSVSLWPPKSPSFLSSPGGAADPPAAAELSEVLIAFSHCHSSATTPNDKQ